MLGLERDPVQPWGRMRPARRHFKPNWSLLAVIAADVALWGCVIAAVREALVVIG